jgi:hypothetical protein
MTDIILCPYGKVMNHSMSDLPAHVTEDNAGVETAVHCLDTTALDAMISIV